LTDTSAVGPVATVYGYPRQGADRALKKAIESYWAETSPADVLLAAARDLRLERLAELSDAGLREIPSNDFSLYDHVLDTAWMVGAIPARHRAAVPDVSTAGGRLDRYFAMARGAADVAPLEMTKWFDTNYHYLVPELGPDTEFRLDPSKPLGEFTEALEAGALTRPVILGPISFLLLSKHEPPAALRISSRWRCWIGSSPAMSSCSPGCMKLVRHGCSSTSRHWSATSRRPC
jgi:5-methyltetrahydropteroyltriglutamate--homocysteine methyltransferase